MDTREQLRAGKNIIDADAAFADGHANGRSYYYDRNQQLPRPVSSERLRVFMVRNLFDPSEPELWNAGFVVGWMEAFFENDPASFYTSIIIPEPVHVAPTR